MSAFSTPIVWDTPAGKQVVAAGYGRMIAYDLKTRDERWSVAGTARSPCGPAGPGT
jgi:hypothetical protein